MASERGSRRRSNSAGQNSQQAQQQREQEQLFERVFACRSFAELQEFAAAGERLLSDLPPKPAKEQAEGPDFEECVRRMHDFFSHAENYCRLSCEERQQYLLDGGQCVSELGLYWGLQALGRKLSPEVRDAFFSEMMLGVQRYFKLNALLHPEFAAAEDAEYVSAEDSEPRQAVLYLKAKPSGEMIKVPLGSCLSAVMRFKQEQCDDAALRLGVSPLNTAAALTDVCSVYTLPSPVLAALYMTAMEGGLPRLIEQLGIWCNDAADFGDFAAQVQYLLHSVKDLETLDKNKLHFFLLRASRGCLTGKSSDFEPFTEEGDIYRTFLKKDTCLWSAVLLCEEVLSGLSSVLPGVPAHTAYLIGKAYLYGEDGLTPDAGEAAGWLSYAALAGHPLGFLLYTLQMYHEPPQPYGSPRAAALCALKAAVLYQQLQQPDSRVSFSLPPVLGSGCSTAAVLLYHALSGLLQDFLHQRAWGSTDPEEQALAAQLCPAPFDSLLEEAESLKCSADFKLLSGVYAALCLAGCSSLALSFTIDWAREALLEHLEDEPLTSQLEDLQEGMPFNLALHTKALELLLLKSGKEGGLYALQAAGLLLGLGSDFTQLFTQVLPEFKRRALEGSLSAYARLKGMALHYKKAARFIESSADKVQEACVRRHSAFIENIDALPSELKLTAARWSLFCGCTAGAKQLADLTPEPQLAASLRAYACWQEGTYQPQPEAAAQQPSEKLLPVMEVLHETAKAALDGSPSHCLMLAALYHFGVLLPGDRFLSEYWLRTAQQCMNLKQRAEWSAADLNRTAAWSSLSRELCAPGWAAQGRFADAAAGLTADGDVLTKSVLFNALGLMLDALSAALEQPRCDLERFLALQVQQAALRQGVLTSAESEDMFSMQVINQKSGRSFTIDDPCFALCALIDNLPQRPFLNHGIEAHTQAVTAAVLEQRCLKTPSELPLRLYLKALLRFMPLSGRPDYAAAREILQDCLNAGMSAAAIYYYARLDLLEGAADSAWRAEDSAEEQVKQAAANAVLISTDAPAQ